MQREICSGLRKQERALESSDINTSPVPQRFRGSRAFRVCCYSITELKPCIGCKFPRPGTGSYLCAACTFGQAISTALVGEDRSSPAATLPAAGEFQPFREELECMEWRDGAPD